MKSSRKLGGIVIVWGIVFWLFGITLNTVLVLSFIEVVLTIYNKIWDKIEQNKKMAKE